MGGGASTRVSVPEKRVASIFYIKGGISFFNCRHLLMENIRPCGDGYEMEYEGTGQYYQPFGEYQGTNDWWEMDHSGAGRPVIFQ